MENSSGLIGQTIGKYRIVEHLGRGGMAEVYKAYQPSLDRYVALKLMHAFLADDAGFQARFEREAKNVAALRHPNIVQVFDFDLHQGTPFMVMEFVEGGTLKTHLENLARQGRALTLTEAIHIVVEVGKALAYAHGRQMIHRDVKPANVLLDRGGRIILTDFGIAKILTGPSYTMTGMSVGTPSYMSPEQGLGKPGDHRSDIYALGVMLYQLTTGQLPYEADTPLAVMLKHVNEPLPLPRSVAPDLPEGVERVILKAMAKSPDDRFQSADEMLANLGDKEAARRLPIPPASMAAGREAHATTLAGQPGQARPSLPTIITGGPGGASGATRAAPGAPATQIGQPPGRPAAAPLGAPLARPQRMPLLLFAAAGLALLFVAVGGGAFAFTGGFGLLRRTTATATAAQLTRPPAATKPGATAPPNATQGPASPAAPGSSTPDIVATQLRAVGLTQTALALGPGTATPSDTPTPTGTPIPCVYAYEVTAQEPADGRTLTVGTRITKRVTLKNTGTCGYPAGTLLVETQLAASATPVSVEVPTLQPDTTAEVSFAWQGPRQAGTQTRTFELRLPDGTVVGAALSFSFRYVPAATAAPTAPPNTPVPTAPAAPTTPPRVLEDFFPSYTLCNYEGAIDYRCSVSLQIQGGVGPFVVTVEGTVIGSFYTGQPANFVLVWRRCNIVPYTVNVRDDGSGTQLTKSFAFDPASSGGLFPGGACATPSP